jgi:hypothetical protein
MKILKHISLSLLEISAPSAVLTPGAELVFYFCYIHTPYIIIWRGRYYYSIIREDEFGSGDSGHVLC